MAAGFFVTGTDTGVGKTVAAAAVVAALNAAGARTAVMKPIESGCAKKRGRLIPSDGTFLRDIAEMKEPLSCVTPVRFAHPLAPLAAAKLENTTLRIAEIRKCFHRLCARYDAVIVEGIGGLMVPLRDNYFVRDLASELGLPVLIVSRPGLGALNHILLTTEVCAAAGLEVAGIILNHSRQPAGDLAEKTNPGILAGIGRPPVLGTLPYLCRISRETLRSAAVEHLDIARLRRLLTDHMRGNTG